MLVDAGEDLLEDVLGVVGREPERLGRDRVDVAGEALDELVPGGRLSASAPGDELRVGCGFCHVAEATA
jgi:hypothetical protein